MAKDINGRSIECGMTVVGVGEDRLPMGLRGAARKFCGRRWVVTRVVLQYLDVREVGKRKGGHAGWDGRRFEIDSPSGQTGYL